MSIYEKEFFPRFCDTPPLVFTLGWLESISKDRDQAFDRIVALGNQEPSPKNGFDKEENREKQGELASEYREMTDFLVKLNNFKEDGIARRTAFFNKTGKVYAECICFAYGFAIYLDEDGKLFFSDNASHLRKGSVREKDTPLIPIEGLPSNEKDEIVELVVSIIPEACCSLAGLIERYNERFEHVVAKHQERIELFDEFRRLQADFDLEAKAAQSRAVAVSPEMKPAESENRSAKTSGTKI